jgi:uroporphyrin-III C-methyltransferase/precorrin-2 dehydrogenase/sirohydrochlorin ferrochelatase
VVVNGRVTLVGAGPGDPGLLTRRAVARLRAAELVLYDALVDERVLRIARRAQKFYVGKRAGRHAMTQEGINSLMIRAARRGCRVVRLKGGDPFVFGRGGEEVLALQRAGVTHEVVPGISSAIAAPAAAGIPVTHRGISTAFVVVSGHDEAGFADVTAGLPHNGLTLVVLMGIARASAIACCLLNHGWPRGTPVAIVNDATTSAQKLWRGTLADLAAGHHVVDGAGASSAGTIIVGDVVTVNRQAARGQALACGS